MRTYFVIGFCCSLRFVRGVRGSCCCSCLKWEPIFVIGFCCSLSFVRGVRGPFSGACLKRKPILSSASVVLWVLSEVLGDHCVCSCLKWGPILSSASVVLWGLPEVLEDRVVVPVLNENLFVIGFCCSLRFVRGARGSCCCSCLKRGLIMSSASVVLWSLAEVLEDRIVVPVLSENLFRHRLLLFFEVWQRC